MKHYYEQFRLTEHHITLLQAMYCSFDDGGYEGAPAINLKRPYGNSDVYGDINDLIFKVEFDGDSDMPDDLFEACATLHKETGKALQVCLSTLSFKPGLYGRPEEFCTRAWEWISE